MNCPLCDATGCELLLTDRRRRYCFCNACELIFVPIEDHITPEDEKKRYDLHDNTAGNPGYVRFLGEIVDIVEGLKLDGPRIIDFGSGRNAVLGGLLQWRGFSAESYDPLYSLGAECLSGKYDILVLCEAIEHLRGLKDEIRTINNMLDDNGRIVLRTGTYPSLKGFGAWWYKEDITHINFFNRKSIEVFASRIGGKKVEQKGNNIFILH